MAKRDENFSRGGNLRRGFWPREFRVDNGDTVFRTSDATTYRRDKVTGVVRRARPKPVGKKERRKQREKLWAEQRDRLQKVKASIEAGHAIEATASTEPTK